MPLFTIANMTTMTVSLTVVEALTQLQQSLLLIPLLLLPNPIKIAIIMNTMKDL